MKSVVKPAALVLGPGLAVAGLVLAGVAIVVASGTGGRALASGAVLVLVGEVALVLGLLLLWVGSPLLAKLAVGLLGVLLVVGGAGLLIAGPVLRQMDSPDLAEGRAGAVAFVSGAFALALGLLLSALGVLWARSPDVARLLSRAGRVIAIGYGVLLFLQGLNLALVVPFSGLMGEEGDVTTLERSATFASIAFLGLLPGTILVYHGISAAMGEESGPFRAPSAAGPLALFGLSIALGAAAMAAAMAASTPLAAPMPPLHLLAGVLPAVALVGIVATGMRGRGTALPGLTWRQLLLAIALSMALAMTLVALLEGLAGGGMLVALLSRAGAFEGARDLEDVGNALRDSDLFLGKGEQLLLVMVLAAVVAPLVEEAFKGLAVRLTLSEGSTRFSAMVLGVAAGAAFGVMEALAYGLYAFSDPSLDWWSLMLVRAGATVMHAFNTALVGLGWYAGLREGRWRRALAAYGAAVAIHAAWNALAVLVSTRFILPLEGLSDRELAALGYAFMAPLACLLLAALMAMSRRVQRGAEAWVGPPGVTEAQPAS